MSQFNAPIEAYCKYCSKLCKSRNSLSQHECRCPNNPNRRNYNQLTKHVQEHVKGKNRYNCKQIEKQCITMEHKYSSGYVSPLKGKPGTFTGHKHTSATKEVMSEKGRYNAVNRINGWKSGNSKIPNKYEKFTAKYLSEHNIVFESEVIVAQSKLGKKGSYYQLDFVINGNIDLEIDGSSHTLSHDTERDKYLSKLYKVYRIQHNDSLELLESKLDEFIEYLHID